MEKAGADVLRSHHHSRLDSSSSGSSQRLRVKRPKSLSPAEKLYCICRLPYDKRFFYIACDHCDEWYHGKCVNVRQNSKESRGHWFCLNCRFLPEVLSREQNQSPAAGRSKRPGQTTPRAHPSAATRKVKPYTTSPKKARKPSMSYSSKPETPKIFKGMNSNPSTVYSKSVHSQNPLPSSSSGNRKRKDTNESSIYKRRKNETDEVVEALELLKSGGAGRPSWSGLPSVFALAANRNGATNGMPEALGGEAVMEGQIAGKSALGQEKTKDRSEVIAAENTEYFKAFLDKTDTDLDWKTMCICGQLDFTVLTKRKMLCFKCDDCNKWFHSRCSGYSMVSMRRKKKAQDPLKCPTCRNDVGWTKLQERTMTDGDFKFLRAVLENITKCQIRDSILKLNRYPAGTPGVIESPGLLDIEVKLNAHQYEKVGEAMRDVGLVFDNAFTAFDETSDDYKSVDHMEDYFMDCLKAIIECRNLQ